MSFLSAVSIPHSHDPGGRRNSNSRSQSHSPNQSTIDINLLRHQKSNHDAPSCLGIESSVSKSVDSFLPEAHRICSLHTSTSPKSARSMSSIEYEKSQGSGSHLKFHEPHGNSQLNCGDSFSRKHTYNHHPYDERHDHKAHDYDSKFSSNLALDQKIKPQIESRSRLTNCLLHISLKWPFLHAILSEKGSRRIFYFMSLNFSFMLVQAFYGLLTDSLGLISDSIHMCFDCLALAVGLFAAIASKWPPSTRFPYGFGKIESLSGFANGIFLVLISIEIMTEATERLVEGRETKRLKELFTVSCLGLAVNLVGMACFGHHGHSGHGCGGHSHSHSHKHVHSHFSSPQVDARGHSFSSLKHKKDTDLLHDKNPCPEKLSQTLDTASKLSVFHSLSHSHENDNLHGIFLHLAADTMGSAAVILSTAFIHLTGFNGWDPIASCVIAILIFLSSIPLIKSSAMKLLLTLPDDKEYALRNILASISELRGVSSYYAPRFWLVGTKTESEDQKVNGVIHIVAERGSDLDDLRKRTQEYLNSHNLDVAIQVENDNDLNCWCGDIKGNSKSSMI